MGAHRKCFPARNVSEHVFEVRIEHYRHIRLTHTERQI